MVLASSDRALPSPRGFGEKGAMGKRYLEDFTVGETIDLGSKTVSRDEIVRFAREFDPQPFHVDEEAARSTIYRGLIASGWHTVAIFMRLLVDGMLKGSASMGSPGVDEVRWLVPVRPGDTLTARALVLDVVPSRSKPDRGHIRTTYEAHNQKGEKVMTMTGRGIFGRRPAAWHPTDVTDPVRPPRPA
jgi:acyl dehydratase